MKRGLKIFGIFVLSAIYYLAVDLSVPSAKDSNFRGNKTEQEKYSSSVSSIHFFHTSQSVNAVPNAGTSAISNYKNPFQDFWPVVTVARHLFEATFAQYTRSSKNFRVQYRKTDILFPKHYFW